MISLWGNSLLILGMVGLLVALLRTVCVITNRDCHSGISRTAAFGGYFVRLISGISGGIGVMPVIPPEIPDNRSANGLKAMAPLDSGMTSNRNDNVLYLSSLAVICSFLLLVYAFVSSDFSIRNVFLNSSTIKPLIYRVAGSWASHEGSILLYVALLSTVSSLYLKFSNYEGKTRNIQIAILAFVQLLFLCFIYLTSNPFDSFKFVPGQGLGLNPVLQDKALSIHPPLLYMGYVTYIVTYVNGILLLLRPQDEKAILKNNLLFSSVALMALTAGIGLGSWWAYRELGWGGYWFFDPVENISLMPWLVGIALHHFLLVTNKSGRFLDLTIFTSILAFLLTTYGIFFVRSGIISSVHSFAFSAERGLYLFVICGVLTLVGVIAFIARKKSHDVIARSVTTKQSQELYDNITPSLLRLPRPLHGLAMTLSACNDAARLYLILIANILWLLAFVSLMLALIYPLYYSFIYKIDVAIDPNYFYKIFIPIFVPIIVLAGIAPNEERFLRLPRRLLRNLLAITLSGIVVILFHHYAKVIGIISGCIIFASVFLMAQMVDFGLTQSHYFKQSISASKLALLLGHFGLGLLAFSITANVLFSEEIEFIGKRGDTVSNDSFTVKLNDVKFADSAVYYRQIAEFSVWDNKRDIVILKPENRLYKIEKTLSQESDIYSYLTHDMFAVLSKINGEIIHATIYYRPMIFFIWFSVFLMSGAFVVYVWGAKRSLRGCAP